MSRPRVNGDRLWQSLMEMAQIGATAKGGVCRLALSKEDLQARELLSNWCEALGMEERFDAMGNQFARYAGKNPNARPILLGSHLDSQPTGGKYDGVLGVLAGLEVIRTLAEEDLRLDHPIELVNWTNEEGARFAPAMIGSGVFAGAFELEAAHQIQDQEGISIKEALEGIGHLGPEGNRSSYHASLELHIEQGPVLEEREKSVGIVTGVQGMRWYECKVKGKSAHAGTTPMEMRNDPVQNAMALIQKLYQLVKKDPKAKITIGMLRAEPGSINTVPNEVIFNIDFRHPEEEGLVNLNRDLKNLVEVEIDAEISLIEIWFSPPVDFYPDCVEAVEKACKTLNIDAWPMTSGAGHDSVYLSKVMPAGMIFIPCKDGLNHNEAESVEKAHAIDGANVLLHAVLELDRQPNLNHETKEK